MKALTIRQPWAALILSGAKEYETRPWRTSYRGRLAIHAGLAPMPKWLDDPILEALTACQAPLDLPRGVVVAVASLVSILPVDVLAIGERERAFGDYSPGRWAWQLVDVEPLPEPIRAKGALSLWNWT